MTRTSWRGYRLFMRTLVSPLLFVVATAVGCASSPPPSAATSPAPAPAPAGSAGGQAASAPSGQAASAPSGQAAAASPSSPGATTAPGGEPKGGAAAGAISPAVRAAVDAPDRAPADRALDAGRKPGEVLSFLGIAPGMKVAELGAGTGATTELLARIVGPSGVVYAENPRFFLEKFAEKPWSERLSKPVMRNVKRVDRELDDPLPPEAKDLDAVVFVLVYHDAVWLGADRAKMNKAVFDALKHGGVYGIVDHAARAGAGTNDVKTLHRIEEKTLVDEVKRAGFELAAEADFLRNPADARDWSASPMAAGARRGTSDRFVLKFVKP